MPQVALQDPVDHADQVPPDGQSDASVGALHPLDGLAVDGDDIVDVGQAPKLLTAGQGDGIQVVSHLRLFTGAPSKYQFPSGPHSKFSVNGTAS
jgi:hypothetical protein